MSVSSDKHSNDVEQSFELQDHQKAILQWVIQDGQSCFITGGAGTGKSVLLKHIIHAKSQQYGNKVNCVAVCGPTGVASQRIGGTTMHSYFGLPMKFGELDPSELAERYKKKYFHRSRWLKLQCLILDEISMISSKQWNVLEQVACILKQSKNAYFGGVQLVLSGDFLQLPPIDDQPQALAYGQTQRHNDYIFNSPQWVAEFERKTFLLHHVYRQQDPTFQRLLHNMRVGLVSQQDKQLLLSCVNRKLDGIPMRIYPKRDQVNKINDDFLWNMPLAAGEQRMIYHSHDVCKPLFLSETLLPQLRCQKELHLKKGCPVLLIRNLDVKRGLVNGSQGEVLRFDAQSHYPWVRFASCPTPVLIKPHCFEMLRGRQITQTQQCQRTQLPLLLGAAGTIHSCQGMTLQRIEASLEGLFAPHMAYVILSRCPSLESIRLTGINLHDLRMDPSVIKYYKNISDAIQWKLMGDKNPKHQARITMVPCSVSKRNTVLHQRRRRKQLTSHISTQPISKAPEGKAPISVPPVSLASTDEQDSTPDRNMFDTLDRIEGFY